MPIQAVNSYPAAVNIFFYNLLCNASCFWVWFLRNSTLIVSEILFFFFFEGGQVQEDSCLPSPAQTGSPNISVTRGNSISIPPYNPEAPREQICRTRPNRKLLQLFGSRHGNAVQIPVLLIWRR